MPKLRLAAPITFDSVVDGPGLRSVVWLQGCLHACPGCHNTNTHDIGAGSLVAISDIVSQIKHDPIQTGLTISGGEPLLQAKEVLELLRQLRPFTKSIWLYTGYTFEELTNETNPLYETYMRILGYLDVLVDGRFVLAKRDISLLFRGSSNQRLIDINRTAWANDIVLWNREQ